MKGDLIRGIAGKPRGLLILAILVYVVVFSTYSLLKYYDFRTLYYDLGITTYSMNRVLRGSERLETLILPSTPGHIGHFSPILVVPLGLYALLPCPETLLVFQSLLLGLAALPLFRVGETILGRRDHALLISLAYLLYPALHGVNQYDFHAEAFIPLFGFLALLALLRNRYWAFVAACVALLITHEFVSVIIIFTGGLLLVGHYLLRKEPLEGRAAGRYSLTLFVLGLAFLALSEALTRLLSGGRSLLGWLEPYPGAPGGSLSTFTLGPTEVDFVGKLAYWFLLLAPLLLLPLRQWKVALPALPWVAVSLLSVRLPFYSIYYQYSAFVIPILFLSAIWALRHSRHLPFLPKYLRGTPALLLAGTLIFASIFSVLSPLNPWDGVIASGNALGRYPPVVTAHDTATSRLLGLIPVESRVLAQDELFPQVSNRREVALNWNPAEARPPDFIAVDVSRSFFWNSPDPLLAPLSRQLPTLLSSRNYSLRGFSDSTFVYGLGPPGSVAYAVDAPAMPRSLEEFRSVWSSEGAVATYGLEGISLEPSGSVQGFVWTRLAEPTRTARFDFVLDSGGVTGPQTWSGILLSYYSPTNYTAVYFIPSQGQVRYARVHADNVTDQAVGNYTAPGGRILAQVLWSGGTVQVWVDHIQAGIIYPVDATPSGTIGFTTFRGAIGVANLSIERSTAGEIPVASQVPWPAFAAILAIVVPPMVFVARQDWIVGWLRRVWRVGHGPQNHRPG